ncbi:hypothetical protein COT54_01330, partial [Candidatus Collierbacteria bacterium CG09_land_8_20_14_0_10_46_12]
MLKQITKYFLITLILSLGFGQLLRFDLFGLPLYLHDMLVICLLILQGQALQVRKIHLQGLALLGAGLFISSIRALTLYPLTDLLIPSLYTLRLLAYLALYLILNHKSYIINQKYFYISGMIAIIIGLAQYIFMPD